MRKLERQQLDQKEPEILQDAIQQVPGRTLRNGWVLPGSLDQVVRACNQALHTDFPTNTILVILRDHIGCGRMPDVRIVHGAMDLGPDVIYRPSADSTSQRTCPTCGQCIA